VSAYEPGGHGWIPVRAQARLSGSIPSGGCAGGSQSMILSHYECFSLPLPFSLKSIYLYIYIYIFFFFLKIAILDGVLRKASEIKPFE
jgi:hypothetical protein